MLVMMDYESRAFITGDFTGKVSFELFSLVMAGIVRGIHKTFGTVFVSMKICKLSPEIYLYLFQRGE